MMEENSPMGFTIAAIVIVFVVSRRRRHFVVTAEVLSATLPVGIWLSHTTILTTITHARHQ
jgi:hypothetical protein